MKRIEGWGGLGVAAVLLAGCATAPATPPERVVTVEVAVPVPSPCVPANLGPAPEYPDTDEALRAAPDAATRYLLLGAGRLLRIARANEVEPVVAACPRAAQ